MLRGSPLGAERTPTTRRSAAYTARAPQDGLERRTAAAVGLAWLAALALPLACTPRPDDPASSGASASKPGAAEPVYGLALDGVSVLEHDDSGSSSLTARHVVYRNRSGAAGFLTYHDLAELLAVDVDLSIQLSSSGGFSSIFERVKRLLAPESTVEPFEREASRAGPIVTRLLFENLSIRQQSPGKELSLEADRATLNFDSETLVLDGRVVMRTSGGEEVRSRRAVLSGEQDGMYLPLGHTRGGRHLATSSFLVLDSQGRLSATPGTRHIAYEDLIEKRERLVLDHFAKRAPQALKPLLMAILAQLGSGPR